MEQRGAGKKQPVMKELQELQADRVTLEGIGEYLGARADRLDRIVKELNARVVQKGGMYIKGKVPAAEK